MDPQNDYQSNPPQPPLPAGGAPLPPPTPGPAAQPQSSPPQPQPYQQAPEYYRYAEQTQAEAAPPAAAPAVEPTAPSPQPPAAPAPSPAAAAEPPPSLSPESQESQFATYEFPSAYRPSAHQPSAPQSVEPAFEPTPPASLEAMPPPAVAPTVPPAPQIASTPAVEPTPPLPTDTTVPPPASQVFAPPPLEPAPAPIAEVPAAAFSTPNNGPVQKWRQNLAENLKKVDKASAKKRLRPLISAGVTGALIYGVFNSQLLLGQIKYLVSPGADAAAVVSPGQQTAGPSPEVIIPKINLRAPVVYDVKSFEEQAIQKGLERGVVHYGTTAVPGQKGNNVIVGHSSNNWWASGKYKFAFVLLNKLDVGDTFYLSYRKKLYTYEVKSKEIILPNNLRILNQNVKRPIATLITCDPPGTSWKRLVVVGEQVDPDPSGATSSTSRGELPSADRTQLPGYGESFFSRLGDLF